MWTITKDYIADETRPEGTYANAATVVGPSNANLTHEEIKDSKLARKFRMKDSDGELYYEGFNLSNNLFAPLEDFGTPNAGATTIEYYINGKWEEV